MPGLGRTGAAVRARRPTDAARPSAARGPGRWRGAWRRWWEQRHPRCDDLLLTQRNVYILPTGAGWLFALLLLTLLLASINYQLNLGYLLTFLLSGVGLSSIHTTHATLRGLRLQAHAGEPVFAGEAAGLHIRLSDAAGPDAAAGGAASGGGTARWRRQRALNRHGIGLRLSTPDATAGPAPDADDATWVDVPADGSTTLQLTQRLPKRGRHLAGTVTVETRYPFGLFRAWTVWRPAAGWLAWPAPERPTPPLPRQAQALSLQQAGASTAVSADEPAGVRAWRPGDAPARVLWKKSAQSLAGGGTLLSREMAGQPPGELRLDWSDCAVADTERRLSRLAAWVLAAEAAGQPYTLGLPGQTLASGLGPEQRREALQRLARWGESRGDDQVGPGVLRR